MNKANFFIILLIGTSLTGCIDLGIMDDENNPKNLQQSFSDYISSINSKNYRQVCEYMVYNFDSVSNLIMLGSSAELNLCVGELREEDNVEYKVTWNNYTEENLDFKAASNSGSVYAVKVFLEDCQREDEFEPWDCTEEYESVQEWVKVGNQWIWWGGGYSIEPELTFYVQESSAGYYDAEVIKATKSKETIKFEFYLKDSTDSTYTGGNGFGEIAMQVISGEEHGIEASYHGDDEQLQSRSDNVSDDDGTQFPVHFFDNDRDNQLSTGDMFRVFGTGNSANGPAEDGWKLEIRYKPTGGLSGTVKLL